MWTVVFGSVRQERSAADLAVCVGTGGLAGEDLFVGASGSLVSLVSEGVQEAGMGGLSRADPGPADSAVAAGSGESAVGSELGSLVRKVGSALVSSFFLSHVTTGSLVRWSTQLDQRVRSVTLLCANSGWVYLSSAVWI